MHVFNFETKFRGGLKNLSEVKEGKNVKMSTLRFNLYSLKSCKEITDRGENARHSSQSRLNGQESGLPRKLIQFAQVFLNRQIFLCYEFRPLNNGSHLRYRCLLIVIMRRLLV